MQRRDFIKGSVVAVSSLFGIPAILSSRCFAKTLANDKINIAQIGFGRYALEVDVPETLKFDICRMVAIADVDINRAKYGKKWVENYYKNKTGKDNYVDIKIYQDYRELLNDSSIDAVIVSTPDHWHAQIAMEAALKGKDIYLQKPSSLTIQEGRQICECIKNTGRILQVGTQQRSLYPWPQFKQVCELVRNGKIGQLKQIKIGIQSDPACGAEPKMPVPENLNYDMWLGAAADAYYTEKRVHPQSSYDIPGWMKCEDFCLGQITNFGVHCVDIAHWAMGTEDTGPIEVEGRADFSKSGLWNVHGDCDVYSKYANGVSMYISSRLPGVIHFEGTEGWLSVSRGSLNASNPELLKIQLSSNDTQLYASPEHHLNWLESIRSRKQTISPIEVGHRSSSACMVNYISMKLGRKLNWDPAKEEFVNDKEANSMLFRTQRGSYGTNSVKV